MTAAGISFCCVATALLIVSRRIKSMDTVTALDVLQVFWLVSRFHCLPAFRTVVLPTLKPVMKRFVVKLTAAQLPGIFTRFPTKTWQR